VRADELVESGLSSGPVNVLAMLCASRMDVQQTRLALKQRGMDPLADDLAKTEAKLDRAIKKQLMAHPLWPWLSQYPGLGGVQTARLIALIDDPRRFPGQKCTAGHTVAPDHEVGAPCPWVGIDKEAVCEGTMLPPRETTGVRSLWHYLGLHAVDGKSPKKQKGKRADWSPVGRTTVLMPGGIADSIIKLRTPLYRDEYDRQKERLTHERGAEVAGVSEGTGGPAQLHEEGPEDDSRVARDVSCGLRPFQIHERARKIAAKKFVGDLLVEWKRLVA
jgi:hypothetical protein